MSKPWPPASHWKSSCRNQKNVTNLLEGAKKASWPHQATMPSPFFPVYSWVPYLSSWGVPQWNQIWTLSAEGSIEISANLSDAIYIARILMDSNKFKCVWSLFHHCFMVHCVHSGCKPLKSMSLHRTKKRHWHRHPGHSLKIVLAQDGCGRSSLRGDQAWDAELSEGIAENVEPFESDSPFKKIKRPYKLDMTSIAMQEKNQTLGSIQSEFKLNPRTHIASKAVSVSKYLENTFERCAHVIRCDEMCYLCDSNPTKFAWPFKSGKMNPTQSRGPFFPV